MSFSNNRRLHDALYLKETRRCMKELLNIGLIDSYRLKYPNLKEYSFWDYQAGAWNRNDGIRIDHILMTPACGDMLLECAIDRYVRDREKPSDHVPLWIRLDN